LSKSKNAFTNTLKHNTITLTEYLINEDLKFKGISGNNCLFFKI